LGLGEAPARILFVRAFLSPVTGLVCLTALASPSAQAAWVFIVRSGSDAR
jgi:hypothetical protein